MTIYEQRITKTVNLVDKHVVRLPDPIDEVVVTLLDAIGSFCSVATWVDPSDRRNVVIQVPVPVHNGFLTVIGRRHLG